VTTTADRIRAAARDLFAERGFAGTSIAAIEQGAGLVPRAGTFYRHFPSKEALFEDLARDIVETPAEFEPDPTDPDTRGQLLAFARRFEEAGARQRPWLRLIEEMRLTEAGAAFEARANEEMLQALMGWVATRAAGRGLGRAALAALTLTVFGGWLFHLGKAAQGIDPEAVDPAVMLDTWATLGARLLDAPP
jgi:AcrR family transcriptional regulator